MKIRKRKHYPLHREKNETRVYLALRYRADEVTILHDNIYHEEYVTKLKEDLKNAQDRLDESVRNEETKKAEIEALDDDDDDLFGDEEDEDDEKKKVRLQKTNLYIY